MCQPGLGSFMIESLCFSLSPLVWVWTQATLTILRLETPESRLLQTVGNFANSKDPDEMQHFIRVCAVCEDRIVLQRNTILFDIITCYQDLHLTLDHPVLTVHIKLCAKVH